MSQDLSRFFQVEAEDLVAKIASALDRADGEIIDAETQRDLRRWVHTLKGAAQVVRREEIARSAHELETAMDGLAEEASHETAREAALQTVNTIRQILSAPQMHAGPSEGAAGAPADPGRPIESLRVELGDLDRLLQTINESAILALGIRRSVKPLARARELAAMVRRESASGSSRSLQHVQTLADEIEDVLADIRRDIDNSLAMVQQEVEDSRSLAERLRLVRGQTIVQVLERAMAAAASGSGKLVKLESRGGELEFDAHQLIGIRDALIQIVRNSVAHGIESPDTRTSQDKSATGTVLVAFQHQGSRSVISVHDDGRGIDFDALRRISVERGWLSTSAAQAASPEALTDVLLQPGVTTSASVSMLSGRGVGMDVVSRTVAKLKGELRIRTKRGEGTTFEISLPASLNALPALIVSAGGRQYGIPRDSIVRTVSVNNLERLGRSFVLDGRTMPMVHLATLMGVETGDAVVAAEIAARPQSFLLGLDGMLGIRQLVLHALPEFLELEPYVVGAAVDADGHALPVVNPLLMGSNVNQHLSARSEAVFAGPQALPILIVDDSLTTRMLEQSIFEMEGYNVELASSAEEALATAQERAFGLFLVDVEMPGMDGVAFVEHIRRDPALRDIPAVLVTSKGAAEDRARGLKAGARDYIVKSEFDQRYLIRRVRELIRVAQ
ncbi:MAG TPA: response regulator [Terracidiphilus sp.]|jgi:two-component system chemotaxis sensor kinase CheA